MKTEATLKDIALTLDEAALLRHIQKFDVAQENVDMGDKEIESFQTHLEADGTFNLYLTFFGIDFRFEFNKDETEMFLETLTKKNNNHSKE